MSSFGQGLRSETREIDGITITTRQLPPLRSLALMPRLGKVMAPMLAMDGFTMDSDLEAVLPAIMAVLDKLDDDKIVALTRDLLVSTTAQIDGRIYPLNSDEMLTGVFGGKLVALLKTAVFAVEVNFGDFFASGLAAKHAREQAAAASPSTSTEISPKAG